MPKINKKKKFMNQLEESEYVNVHGTSRTENDNIEINVEFTQNSTYEITEYLCDIADDYDFRVKGIFWEGGVKFVKDDSGYRSKLGL